ADRGSASVVRSRAGRQGPAGGERPGALDLFGTVLTKGSGRSPSCFIGGGDGADNQRRGTACREAGAPRAERRRGREVPGAVVRHPGGGLEGVGARPRRRPADRASARDRERLGGRRATAVPPARRRVRERARPRGRPLPDAARMIDTLTLTAE